MSALNCDPVWKIWVACFKIVARGIHNGTVKRSQAQILSSFVHNVKEKLILNTDFESIFFPFYLIATISLIIIKKQLIARKQNLCSLDGKKMYRNNSVQQLKNKKNNIL